MSNTIECPKCEGTGRLNYHLHIDGGRCFQCAGTGRTRIARASRPMATTPRTFEGVRGELRNLYRAARYWRDLGWGEGEDAPGLDLAKSTAANLVDLPDTEHGTILAAFKAVTSELAYTRIVGFLADFQSRKVA